MIDNKIDEKEASELKKGSTQNFDKRGEKLRNFAFRKENILVIFYRKEVFQQNNYLN